VDKHTLLAIIIEYFLGSGHPSSHPLHRRLQRFVLPNEILTTQLVETK